MKELKLATKIRILQFGERKPMISKGDIAAICKPPKLLRNDPTALRDVDGNKCTHKDDI